MKIFCKCKKMLLGILLVACIALFAGALTMLSPKKAYAATEPTLDVTTEIPEGARDLVNAAIESDKYHEVTVKNVSSLAFTWGGNYGNYNKVLGLTFNGIDDTNSAFNGKLQYTGNAGYISVNSVENAKGIYHNVDYHEDRKLDTGIVALVMDNAGIFSNTETDTIVLKKGFTVVDSEGAAFVLKESYTFYRVNGFFLDKEAIGDITPAKTYTEKITGISLHDGTMLRFNFSGESIENQSGHGNGIYVDWDKIKINDVDQKGKIYKTQTNGTTGLNMTFVSAPTFNDGDKIVVEAGFTALFRGNGSVADETDFVKVVVNEEATFWYNGSSFTNVDPDAIVVPEGAQTLVDTAKTNGEYYEVSIKNVSSISHTGWSGDFAAAYNKVVCVAFNEVEGVDFSFKSALQYAGNKGYYTLNGVDPQQNIWFTAAYNKSDDMFCLTLNNAGTFSNTTTDTIVLKKGFTIVDNAGRAFVLKEDYTFYRVNGFFVTGQEVENVSVYATYNEKIRTVSISGKEMKFVFDGDVMMNTYTHGQMVYADLDKVTLDGNNLQGKIWGGHATGNGKTAERQLTLNFIDAPTLSQGQMLTFEKGFTVMYRGGGDDATIPATELTKVVLSEGAKFVYNGTEFVAYKPSIYGASLTLENNIAVNYYVEELYVETSSTTPTMDITFMGETTTGIEGKRVETETGVYYVYTFAEVNPKYLGENISATLNVTYDGNAETIVKDTFSVETYCKDTLDKPETIDSLKTLIVDLLNYGAAAQTYAGYKTNDLVNAEFGDYQTYATTATPTMNDVLARGDETGKAVTWYGASLVLTDNVVAKFFFTADDATNYTAKVTVEGTETVINEIVKEGKYYTFEFDALNATQLSSAITVEIYNGSELVSSTLTYSVETYAANKANDTDQNLADLVVAMMKYGNAAKLYATRTTD